MYFAGHGLARRAGGDWEVRHKGVTPHAQPPQFQVGAKANTGVSVGEAWHERCKTVDSREVRNG